MSTYDKSGLINEEEAMDYSDSPMDANYSIQNPVGGYQSSAQHPRSGRTASRAPPRGIFDDV